MSLVRAFNRPENQVWVSLVEPVQGVEVEGRDLGELPGGVASLVAATATAQRVYPTMGRALVERRETMPTPVFGSASLLIRVEHHIDR